ncbi:MAG: phosphate ABC transporter permease subunit PstC [Micrococcales bacterium]
MTEAQSSAPARRKLSTKPHSTADRVFYGLARAAAYGAIVLVGLILVFLLLRSGSTFAQQGINFILGSKWNGTLNPPVLQIGPMLWGSILIAICGVLIAVPMSIATAYFIEFMATKRVAKVATIVVDLLAAIPSIVIGLWGLQVFTPIAAHWAQLLNKGLGWLPFFANDTGIFRGSPFIAGWIVAVMIVPIITSVTREIFSQMDRDIINAALALGGSTATSFFRVILPTASGGIVGGVLLGLGRALGETVAIFFVLNLTFEVNWVDVVSNRGGSVASVILSKFGEATTQEIGGLMAAGLVLFIITLLVNWIAAWIVNLAQPWRR